MRRNIIFLIIGSFLCILAAAGASSASESDRYMQNGHFKVVGGSHALLSQWPSMGTLRYYDSVSGLSGHVCGGTMIAPTWMLTAAHCLAIHKESGSLEGCYPDDQGATRCGILEAVLDRDDLSKEVKESVYAIAEIAVHEDFMAAYRKARSLGFSPYEASDSAAMTSGHDIALVRLARPWLGSLARLSLDTRTDPAAYNPDLRVAGFGYFTLPGEARRLRRYVRAGSQTYFAGSDVLLSAKVPLADTNRCLERYRTVHPDATIGLAQICAGTEAGGTDTCQGDSGGPLAAYDLRDEKYQVGVVSWGEGCAEPGWYGIYTRISAHATWLRAHVGELTAVPADFVQTSATRDASSSLSAAAIGQIDDLLEPARGRVTVSIAGGPRVTLHDRYRFEIASAVAGRLIVVDIDAMGKLTQIVPNAYMAQANAADMARIAAGARITVPPADRSWHFDAFQAAPPVGKGRLLVLVVPDKFPLSATVWPADQRERSDGFQEPPASPYLMNLIDQIATTLKAARTAGDSAALAGWGWAALDVEIVP